MNVDQLRREVFRAFPHRCPAAAQQPEGWAPKLCAVCPLCHSPDHRN